MRTLAREKVNEKNMITTINEQISNFAQTERNSEKRLRRIDSRMHSTASWHE